MAFVLKQVVPWGRLFDEYVRMFAPTAEGLKRNIISSGDGPAGFNAGIKNAGSVPFSLTLFTGSP